MLALALALACAPTYTPADPQPVAPAAVDAEAGPPEDAPPPRDRPPRIGAIRLGPAKPRVGDELVVSAEATDPEGAPVDVDYVWSVDGAELLGERSDRLAAGTVRKGQRVQVEVVASDGTNEVRDKSAEVTIANSVPVLDGDLTRMTRIDGFRFRATDADGDEVRWRVEGGPPGLAISEAGVLSYRGSAADPAGEYTVTVYGEDGEGWVKVQFPMTVKAGSGAGKPAAEAETER